MSAVTAGHCLCGAVRFTGHGALTGVTPCHCGQCRAWCSGPFWAAHFEAGVSVEAGATLNWFASSDHGERGFCTVCGTHLFWRMVETGEIVVSWGALDDLTGTRIESHIFHDRKPEQYAFADDAPRYTEAQTLAMFAGGEEGDTP